MSTPPLNTVTTDQNFLQPGTWKLTIDNKLYANVAFFCVEANLPGVGLGEVSTSFRGQAGFVPGDKLTFEPLSVKFMVTERMENYIEILTWLKDNVTSQAIIKHDIILSLLTNKLNRNKQIAFRSAFPTSLSQISLTTQNTDVQYVTSDVTFRYDYFEFI